MSEDIVAANNNDTEEMTETESETALGEGRIIDLITGERELKDTPKEQVRQFIAQALKNQYNIPYEDMEADFGISGGKKRKYIDIAIFHHGKEHSIVNLSRAVICRPMPASSRSARLRDPEDAKKEWLILQEIMEQVESCEYGLWTNKLDIFYFKKVQTRFDVRLETITDWPLSRGSENPNGPTSSGSFYKADKEMLRVAFRRCHNFIHGNEGMPKDTAFRQFLYLIFCKMYNEENPNERLFWVGMREEFTPEGRKNIRERINELFDKVKERYKEIFNSNDEISLSDRALAFIVSELYRYDFTNSEIDAKGVAYQEIVGTNLRGDRGQYFTPRGVVKLAVEILDPKEGERILDPACGTGGFLVATLDYMLNKFCKEKGIKPQDASHPEFSAIRAKLKAFAEHNIFGADFDQFLIGASQMNMVMAGDGRGHLYHLNSLEFPNGHLSGVERAKSDIALGTIDVIMTNPPFGSDIPISESHILDQFDFARPWDKDAEGRYRISTDITKRRTKSSVAPEILFIERCMQWLRPGGRVGIVLPNGILGNPADEYIRQWILKNAWVLASIDIPIEAFVVEANVNILTSLLFLKKKTNEEIRAEALGEVQEYPVFMAVAEKVGVDRRGNTLYKRSPDGEELKKVVDWREKDVQVDGRIVKKRYPVLDREVDDDLPIIADKYREFRQRYPEPGQ
ncbi:MAG: methylation-associated defense system DNA methyltransferase MAD2 [Ktedonobacteraceae bacterium]